VLGRRLTRKSVRIAPRSSAMPVPFEGLEDRRLFSVDPLAHVAAVQPLPYVLEFSGPANGLHDKDGEDIGLTRVQVNKNGQDASYLPANLDLRTDLGVLQVTTTGTAAAGSNYNNDNTLTNALETQFDATTSNWKVSTRLVGPLGFLDIASEQGGIFFGPDQDNYIKLVASVTTVNNTASIEFTDEQSSGTTYVHSVASKTDVGRFADIQTLDLRLEGDAATGHVKAYYAVNGGAYMKVPAEVALGADKRSAFFTAAGRAGLITAHKNDVGPVTVSYDRFEILPGDAVTAQRPSVVNTRPAGGATDVARDGYIAADLNLPNGGVDSNTLNATTVRLYRTSDGAVVPGEPGTTGGGDQILFTPRALLEANTRYTFEVTAGVHDSTGAAFLPFTTTFTTAAAAPTVDPSLAFEKIQLPGTAGLQFTALKVGPDHKLYAGVVDGRIIRYAINGDGTLGAAQTITTLQTANGGNRLLTGFVFDPASTAANPTLWVTHGQYAFGETNEDYADDWTGKLTKLSGADLANVQDALVNLPRSARDHLTNQPVFGPDGALYIPQGSNTSMGASDNAWGAREERLLTGAVLRLDPALLPAGAALDVKTTDGGGTYDPFAAGAPLTIYASGVRNAYDLVWTRDGKLYAPTNGSAAGGSTPARPGLPAMRGVDTTQHDFLFNIQQGGYYGHPNPVRGEYVMGGGYTPADGLDVNEVPDYGVVTKGDPVYPESTYRGYAWDFGLNISPNGAIEYQNSTAFGGALAGKLLVTRYSGPGDLVVLTRNADGSIASQNTGVTGLKGFVDPIDVTEDVASGNLYVSDYGQRSGSARQIWLVRPLAAGATVSTSRSQLVFSDIHAPPHAGSSPNLALRITNRGTAPLTFTGAMSIVDDSSSAGDDSGMFRIVNASSIPSSLGVGESFDVVLNFTAPVVGIESAVLRIRTNDAARPTLDIPLRGVGVAGTGGANEPSLARILRAYQIPTIVGDGPNDSGEDTTAYPNPTADPSSQEVFGMQRLVRAASGPVTIEVLAAEAIATDPSVRFGYYKPGNRGWDAKTELFTISGAEAQSLQATPNGVTSFDPGAGAFGLYSTYPGFATSTKDAGLPREVFSEDALNLWDANAANRHKVRFFPLREKNGTIVPNAFIAAFEEFDNGYDYNDIVVIVRNVRAAPAGPEIGLENIDGAPFTDRLAFNKIQDTDNGTIPANKYHGTSVLRVRNTGSSNLVLGTISTTANFAVLNPPASGTAIAPGATLDLTVSFTATNNTGGDLKTGTLTINSNDMDEPATTVQLAGFWQPYNEGGQEPKLQEVVDTFGYKTKIINAGEVLNSKGRIARVGDEVLSPYWLRADTSRAITIRQLAAFHTQGNTATVHWHQKGSNTLTTLAKHDGVWGQSYFPPRNGTAGAEQTYALFSPTTPFGLKVDSEWSDPAKNPRPANNPDDQGHHMRFWVARDRNGVIIPNTFLMSMDYSGINYDYNDNVYLITNIKPEKPPGVPTGLVASGGGGGIGLDWADNTEGNLAGYNVYRSGSATGTFTKLNATPVSGSSYVDALAPSGTSYYRVTSLDVSGNESAPTAVVSAARTNDTTAPARPAGLTATGSSTGVALDWADNAEADLSGYNVLRSGSATGTFTKINGTILRTSSFVDTTAPAGVTSYYHVVAVDLSGNTSSAATANAVRQAGTTAPAAPANTAARAVSPTRIDVSWAASSGATGYRVERKGPSDANFVEVAGGLTSAGYQDSAVSPDSAYQYRVRAENAGGLSPYGATVSATTPGVVAGAYAGADVGTTMPGSTTVVTEGSAYDVVGGGSDVQGTSDNFHFAHQQRTGDFDVKVRLASVTKAHSWTKAGLMLRDGLAANAVNAFIMATPDINGYRMTYRPTAGGTTVAKGTGPVSYPNTWLRLKREGDVVTGYRSTDGQNWLMVAQARLVLPQTVYFGMALTSHNTTRTATAQFRDLADVGATNPVPPAAPATTTATAAAYNRINVSWAASSGATGYRVERKGSTDAEFTEVASVTGTSYADTTVVANRTYAYRVRAVNAAGMSPYGPAAAATTPTQPTGSSLTGVDIGTTTPPGSTREIVAGRDYDVTAGGSDIAGSKDEFQFAYRQHTGDFDLKVRVQSLVQQDLFTKAGIMARAHLGANSANVFALLTPAEKGLRLTARRTDGASTEAVGSGPQVPPNTWLRLQRVGNVFTAYRSADGVTWTLTKSAEIVLPETLYLGLAATSHNDTVTTLAEFRDFGNV
jgi:fibronectin type 3 domain-containing protein/regulation of enolase protein 1 (concanavalin A-like superfamily)